MVSETRLVEDFYGSDPIAGEDARRELIQKLDEKAVHALIPRQGTAGSVSLQVETRLKSLGRSLGPRIAPYLTEVIADGSWRSKTAASPCFGGFENSAAISGPLVQILKRGGDFDAERLAIEALGFLGVSGWAVDMVRYARSGTWQSATDLGDDFVEPYPFDKLSSYVLEALARFAARAQDRPANDYFFSLLVDFLSLTTVKLPNRGPDGYQLVERHAREFGAWSIDPLIRICTKTTDDRLRRLCVDILASIAPLRAAKFLLDVATSPGAEASVRRGASIALGEIRHPQAAQLLASVLRDPATDRAHLDWAFSTLYAVPVDWPELDDYIDAVLSTQDEPAQQLHYSLAVRNDSRGQSRLVEYLDAPEPFVRWSAALTLARLLGPKSQRYLDHRAEDSGDLLERCAMFAAVARAGRHGTARALHEALTAEPRLSQIRTIWRLEILDAFRFDSSFDQRALTLWRTAADVGARQLQYFEALNPEQFTVKEIGPLKSSATSKNPRLRTVRIFVSYSRRDKAWLERFQLMLSPLVRGDRIDLWDDTRIVPGKWQPQIEKALAAANVALLLVSAKFLASDFIMENELPELLGMAQARGVAIIWVLLEDCLWEESELATYQAEHAAQPLAGMSEAEQTRAIKNTCLRIKDLLNAETVSR